MFGKGQPQKWPGFTPPRSRKMPPLRGLLLLRRVQLRVGDKLQAAAVLDNCLIELGLAGHEQLEHHEIGA